MAPSIHPTAVVDSDAVLAEDVSIGPFAVVGAEVELGAGCRVGASAHLQGPARFGRENVVFPHACVGTDPQDLKFAGERTFLVVGDRNRFRELCTVNRGTEHGGGTTRIGNDNLFMAYTHVAHDCEVGDRVVFANGATLAGHVTVHDDATISAFSAVHQFCRVGRHAYIGGYSVVTQDALPFAKTVGHKPACYGLNRIGLERKGVRAEAMQRLDAALKTLIRRRGDLGELLAEIEAEHEGWTEVQELVDFIRSSERGVIRTRPGRKGGRGG